MKDIFLVSDNTTRYLADRIVRLGKFWTEHPNRPRPKSDVRGHWEKLIHDWAMDDSLPLYVRKNSDNRGSIVRHKSRRLIVPTDNSPARWAFVSACQGDKPSLREIKGMVRRDLIPVAIALSRKESRKARYRRNLSELRKASPNSAGWKVAHIDHVGLKVSRSPRELNIQTLKEHFVKLMSPSNMFAIPKKYSGLAELPEFYEQINNTDDIIRRRSL
jgi:hypothetical protein